MDKTLSRFSPSQKAALLWQRLEAGNERRVIETIQIGVDVETPQKNSGLRPLAAAAAWGMENAVKALLNAGANPKSTGAGKTPGLSSESVLYIAIKQGHGKKKCVEILRLLLEAGADPNHKEKDKGGMTPLLQACWEGGRSKLVRIQMLLDAGGDIHSVDNNGAGLMHQSAHSDPRVIRFLKKAGGDPNHRDREGNTPLHVVATMRAKSSIKPLFAAGADPTLINNRGYTPLDLLETEMPEMTKIRAHFEIEMARWKKRQLKEYLIGGGKRRASPKI